MFIRCRLSDGCHGGEDPKDLDGISAEHWGHDSHTQDDPRTTKLQRLHKVVKDEHEERRRKAAGSQAYCSCTFPHIALDATNYYVVLISCSLLLYPSVLLFLQDLGQTSKEFDMICTYFAYLCNFLRVVLVLYGGCRSSGTPLRISEFKFTLCFQFFQNVFYSLKFETC